MTGTNRARKSPRKGKKSMGAVTMSATQTFSTRIPLNNMPTMEPALTRPTSFEAFQNEFGGKPLPPKLADWLSRTLTSVREASDEQLLAAYRKLMEAVIASPACLDQLKGLQLQTAEDLAEVRQHPEILIFEIIGLLNGSQVSFAEKTRLTQYLLVADQVFVRGL